MGLDDPTAKMSKSLADKRGHAVRLLDEPKEIMRYVSSGPSPIPATRFAFPTTRRKAGVNNLLGIYKAVTGKDETAVLADFADARGYGDLKKRVAEVTIEMLTPIRERHNELMQDPAELDRLMAIGAEQARAVSQPKVDEMKRIMGLVVP
jgi:tryptophanyl-tRNA synthetase